MSHRKFFLVAVASVLLTVVVAGGGGVGNGFINFDDPDVVVQNPRLDDPDVRDVVGVFREIRDHAYLPLYYLALMPEAAIAGKDPAAFHLGSLLWHAANGIALFLLILALTGRRGLALGAALVFVAHPVAVESVAWASGRKDQVSLFGLLLGLAAWTGWLRRGGGGRLGLAAVLFVLACFGKGTVVVFPLLAAAVTAWIGRPADGPSPRRRRAALLWLALLAVVPVVVHLAVARVEGTAGASASHGALDGGMLFLEALGGYGAHLVLPLDLSIHYAMAAPDALSVGFWNGVVVLAILLAGPVLLWRTRFRLAGLGLSWMLAALLPFNNVVPRTAVAMADRYLAAVLPAFALLVAALIMRWPKPVLRWATLGVVVLALAFLSRARTRDFADGETVFRAAMVSEKSDPLPPHMVATALLARARSEPEQRRALTEEAIGLFRRAVGLARTPVQEVRSRLPLGTTLLEEMRYDAALGEFDHVLARVSPAVERFAALDLDLATVRYNRAQCLLGQGRVLDAREVLDALLDEHPGHPLARFTLAGLDIRNGFEALARTETADIEDRSRHLVNRGITAYEELLENAASTRRGEGPWDRATADEVARLVHRELGKTLLVARWRENNLSRALDHAERLVRLAPLDSRGYLLLAQVHQAVGSSIDEVGAELVKALARDPDSVSILIQTARNRMAARQHRFAVKLLRRALQIEPDSVPARSLLSDLFLGQATNHRNEGNDRDALRAALEARTVDPDNVEAYVIEGEIHESQNAWEKAEWAYEAALKRDPEHEAARRGRARFLQAAGLKILSRIRDEVDALPEERRAAEEKRLRDEVVAVFRVALELAAGADDVGIARNYMRRVKLEQQQEASRGAVAQAKISLGAGETASAIGILRSALRDHGTDVEVLHLLGTVLVREGLEGESEALACFEKALDYEPDHLPSLFGAARLLYIKGRKEDALRSARRFLEYAKPYEDVLGSQIDAMQKIVALLDEN